MKKLIIFISLITMVGCSNTVEPTEPSLPEETTTSITDLPVPVSEEVNSVYLSQDKTIGDTSPVTRAMCAKMIAIIFNDKNVIDSMEREISFTDTSVDKWYDKYINAVYVQGFMLGSGSEFLPEESLTVEQAQSLIDVINPDNKVRIEISEDSRNKPISFALWTELLNKMMEDMSGDKTIKEVFGIEEKSIIPLATKKNNSQLKDYFMMTDRGLMSLVGLNMDNYVDKEVRVLVKGDEIISLISIVTDTPTIKNAYITNATAEKISIFSGGIERSYLYANDLKDIAGNICDITIDGENAIQVSVFSEKITGIIKKVDERSIELDIGEFQNDDSIKIYGIESNEVKWRGLSSLVVGSNIAEYIVKDGKILAGIINKSATVEKIRVGISTTNFGGLVHDSVSVMGTTDYNVIVGDEIKKIGAMESFTFDKDLLGQQRVYIYTNDKDGKIAITNIKRNWTNDESPKYRGVIEIAKSGDGLAIVNEVDFEEYLFAVVPSEMPTSHGLEAAKVQAVTARSYAYNQYFANRYHRYGANVDDSVLCQVYNNIPENETSIQAVDETRGLCLTYNNSVISANFFSTSSGMTANSGDVWANSASKQFPTESSAYLLAGKQYEGSDFGDLTIEENAYKFFKNTNIKSFDSSFDWFRWNVEMTAKEIEASINKNIKTRYEAAPQLVKTLQAENIYRSREIESIGELKDIEVVKRGTGGNILQLRILGSEADVLISTEYNIRMLITPTNILGNDIVLNRHDGSQLKNYSLMPSGFFVMDKTYDNNGNLSSIIFHGGGNGHGVGMSQNGVKGMIDEGFDFDEILLHYYKGTEVKKML